MFTGLMAALVQVRLSTMAYYLVEMCPASWTVIHWWRGNSSSLAPARPMVHWLGLSKREFLPVGCIRSAPIPPERLLP